MNSYLRRLFILISAGLISVGTFDHGYAKSYDIETLRDAYVYLLGRAIVVRQEYTDIKEPGVDYNIIKYNPVGSADFVNPNLDVAYLEAWIAVDRETYTLLEIPKVEGRYYTAQICNEWGDVITNINERDYPFHPYGKYAFITPGSKVKVPDDVLPIELHSNKAKMLARVELKSDPDGAVSLQKKFTLKAVGTPKIESAVDIPSFGNKELIGVEIFDNAEKLLTSALDISPVAPEMQAKIRYLARQVSDPKIRVEIDKQIREDVIPYFLKYAVTKSGVYKNNWLGTIGTGNYGKNYWIRSAANLVGIWANTNDEVVYFVATQDADGQPLNGDNSYVISFSESDGPDTVVDGYWSVILVDVPDYRVVANSLDRFNFNSESPLATGEDGSLRILVSQKPGSDIPKSNWLPAPAGKQFSLTFRTYVPKDMVKQGDWFPPAIQKVK